MARAAIAKGYGHHDHTPTLRAELHAIIERALVLLDQIDGDPDLEDGRDCEPSLACPEGREYQVVWCVGCDDDRELA